MWPLMDVSDLVGAELSADRRPGEPLRHHAVARQGRAHARRADFRGRARHRLRDRRAGASSRVETDRGAIACDKVVNCGGQWARQIGALAGVSVPLQPMKHQYIVTEPIPGLARDAPTCAIPTGCTYFKEEVGGLVMGGYEPDPRAWTTGDVARRFRVPAVRRRFRPFRAAHAQRDRARAGAGDSRRQADDPRAGELHLRRQFHPRPRAGMRQFLRRRRLQRLRHRLAAAAPGWALAAMGRDAARRRSTSGRSTSGASRALHARPRLAARRA